MKILHSFKLKIALGLVLFTSLILLGYSALFLSTTQRIGLERMNRELVAMGEPQVNRFHPEDHWNRLDESLRSLREDSSKGGYEFRVSTPAGAPIYTSRHWPTNLTEKIIGIPYPLEILPDPPRNEPPFISDTRPAPGDRPRQRPRPDAPPFAREGGRPDEPRPLHHPTPRFMTITDGHQSWRIMITGNSRISFTLAMDLADFQSELRSVQTLFTLTIPLALFLLATGGWLLAGQALRPIRKLTRVARQISAKDLHQRVPDSKADPEFEELITILNGMLDRLEDSFLQATRFSADAAHELNTPLTILQGQMEQAIQNAPTEADQQAYAGLLEEVQRLKNIVRKLLMIAKADTGQLKLNLERIDLSREIEDLLHDADVLAPGLKIERQLSPRIVVMADPDLLKQVLQNLLSNAIKYNRPEGMIQISLSHENGEARIRVGNTTPPGIAIDDKLLFTRFYRGDSSRSRQIEGVGLGLSLSREIVHAHHGRLVLTESKEGWIAFTLTLPSIIS